MKSASNYLSCDSTKKRILKQIYLNKKFRFWRDQLFRRTFTLHIFVFKIAECPGNRQGAVHPLNHNGATSVLYSRPFWLIWRFMVLDRNIKLKIKMQWKRHFLLLNKKQRKSTQNSAEILNASSFNVFNMIWNCLIWQPVSGILGLKN